jgi:hypothetical protein
MKTIFLTPDVGSQLNGDMLSSLSFELPHRNNIQDPSKETRKFLRVSQAEFCHSWFNVDESSNVMTINGSNVKVPPGQYTMLSLTDAIGPALTFDIGTGHFVYTHTEPFVIGGTLARLMGYREGDRSGANGVLVFHRGANMIFTSCLYIHTPSLTTANFSTATQRSDTLCKISVKSLAFQPIFFDGGEAVELTTPHDVHSLEIEIVDSRGELVDFRGVAWGITLELSTRGDSGGGDGTQKMSLPVPVAESTTNTQSALMKR